MVSRRSLLALLAVAASMLTGCQSTPTRTSPSLGELEHRGKRYTLRDLTSEAYREASTDPFARNFNPDTVLAIEATANRE